MHPFRDHVIYPVLAAVMVAVILAVSNYFGYSAAKILGFEKSNIVSYKRLTFPDEESLASQGDNRVQFCPKEMVPVSCSVLKYPSGVGMCGVTMLSGAETKEELSKLHPDQIVGERTLGRCVVNKCDAPGEDQYWEMTLACGRFSPVHD